MPGSSPPPADTAATLDDTLLPPRGGLSLRTIATLLVFAISATLAGVLVSLRSAELERQAQAEAGQSNLQQARGVTAALDADLGRFGRLLQGQARLIERTGALRQPALLQALMDQYLGVPSIAWAGAADTSGRVLAALDGRLVGVDVSKREWWSAGQGGLYYSDVHEAKLLAGLMPALPSGEPWRFVDLAAPLKDGPRTVGVVALHLSWPWLRERVALFTGAAPAQGAQLYIAGHDGRQRLGPSGEVGDALPLKQLTATGPTGWRVLTWPDGRRYVTAWIASPGSAPYTGLGWTTLVRTPLQTLEAAQATTLQWLWGTAALAVAVATALAWALSSVFLLPLTHFMARVRGLAAGGEPVAAPRLLPRELAQLHAVTLALVAQLREKETALRTALEHVRGSFDSVGRTLPGFLFTRVQRGTETHYTFFSESVTLYLGMNRQALLADTSGRLWLSRVDPDDVRRLVPLITRAVAEGTAQTFVYRVRGSDGQWRHLQASLVPREGGTADERVFDGIALDITPLVEARTRALHANEAKDRFLATMSHELRTPLNGILGFAQLLESRLEREEDRRSAAHIRQAGQNLLRILNDVLDLSKIEAGCLELERLPLRLEELAQSCCDLFAPQAAAKALKLALVLPEVPLPVLLGDALRLQQVLANLLSNAVKFTRQGGVTLALAAQGRDAQGRTLVRLEVRDTGMGMTEDEQRRLFEPFQQAEASTARRFGGTGLGLWISRRLIVAMDGDIAMASTPGQGTVVALSIPFEQAQAGMAVAAAPAPSALTGPDTLPLRVLVVDDVALNREVLCALLQLRGHVVEEVSGGQAAVQRVAAGNIDLVLMDIEMPECDGLEATRAVRALAGDAGRTPVWALTGHTFGYDVDQALAAGMDGHLSKPVDVAALDAVLAQALRAKAQPQGAEAESV